MDPVSHPLFPELIDPSPPVARRTGVLPSQDIRELIEAGNIVGQPPIEADQIQPASLDLRLGSVAYRIRASFLPGESQRVLRKLDLFKTHELDLSRPTVLESGCVYVVPLQEEVRLPSAVFGRANPKSTTGRLDVFTRLIADYGGEFDRVPTGYSGKLYLEIVPRTFSIVVRAGTRMNQLRLVRGAPASSDSQVSELHEKETLVYLENDAPGTPIISSGLWVTVDLEGAGGSDIIGYRAKRHAPLVDLDRIAYYDVAEFWEPIIRGEQKYLILNPDDFYILASKEKVRIPPGYAAEMVGYDPSVGEFRVHYAGFFDPGFGYGSDEVLGTRAVLEVRSHEVPFVLEDGQRVGRLIYDRLLSVPDIIYGVGIGSSYQRQGVSLSKQFKRT